MSDHGQTSRNSPEPASSDFALGTPDDPAEGVDLDLDEDVFLPEDEEEDTARRARTRKIVLVVLLVIAIVALGVLGWFGWLVHSAKQVSLTTPATVGTLSLDKSTDAVSSAEYLRDALTAEISVDKATGAVYTAGDGKDVLFFGGTALFWKPGNDLKTAFGLIADNQGAVTGLHDVDAGSLGGTMQCGTTKTDDGVLTVCGWADHGSVAVAMFPNRTEAEAAPLFRQLREAIEHKN